MPSDCFLLSCLALLSIIYTSNAQCGNYDGLPLAQTDLLRRVIQKVQAPEPCECKLDCTSNELGFFRRTCEEEFDACAQCEDSCGPKECLEWVLVEEGETSSICEQVSVTPCTCCVQTDDYFLEVCEWAPEYNNTCGHDLCGLCTVICDIPTCEWLDPLGDHSPYDQETSAIIRNYLLAILSIDAFSACVPEAVEDIIMKLSGYIVLDKCADIHLSGQELATLTLYLDGGLGTPVCPCDCPDDTPLEKVFLKNGELLALIE